MTDIPLTPHFRKYRGNKQEIQQKTAEKNKLYQHIADYVNHLAANDPREHQLFLFGSIAAKLRVDIQDVQYAISDGGSNGITLHIFAADRPALERYKSWPLR